MHIKKWGKQKIEKFIFFINLKEEKTREKMVQKIDKTEKKQQ